MKYNYLKLKTFLLIILITFTVLIQLEAQKQPLDTSGSYGDYKAEWDSLDSRRAPQWYSDAKFGIFIHWGLYSVPAAAPVGAYAEWYWKHLKRGYTWSHYKGEGEPIHKYHREKYGRKFPYENFEKGFTAEKFDAEKWATLFQKAGAKYIAITSKHHEGFCLWPDEYANSMRGRAWNSMDGTAGRDILGELSTAVRETDVRFGIYYSLYEWGNPTWTWKKRTYIDKNMIPQFQKMVSTYRPDLIFADGEWNLHSKSWRSEEIVAWLFNTNNEIVVNDRWGFETRHRHGTYYTTEYGSGLDNDSHPWEENRGIGWSYGYNQFEKKEDYRSSQELILMLIDIVSRGGNFLLNIGPKADGTIPEIMQNRLIGIGQWLEQNGEAIYGTSMWKKACQWSGGKVKEEKRSNFGGGYNILHQTINAEEGDAVKEIFFTQKEKNLYLIFPKLPKSSHLEVIDLKCSNIENVSFLVGGPLSFDKGDKGVVLDLSEMSAMDFTSPISVVVRLK